MIPTIICLRGLPGMGKTTLANMIVMDRKDSVIVSADHFFVEQNPDGDYRWSADLLPKVHEACFEEFKKAINDSRINTIVIDNVNYLREHFARYHRIAKACGAKWLEIHVGSLDPEASMERNIHGVPAATIKNMVDRWER